MVWLGTFRERLRQARGEDRVEVMTAIQGLEARFKDARAEFS